MAKHFPEYNLYIAPDGTELKFGSSDRFVQSFDGEGMSPIEYVEQQGALQHGTTIYDYKLQKRIVQWVVRQNGCDRFDYWENRDHFIDVLRPNRHLINNFGPGVLRKLRPDGQIRDLDVHLEFGPKFATPQGVWDEWGFTDTLRFVAPNPTYYDPTVQTVTWSAFLAISDIVFPITFPITFSSSTLNSSGNIVTYTGTWLTYPTIEITGPIGGFTITNASTGEFIRLNYNINSGEVVTIGLQYGNKTVENAAGTNLIGVVTTDSDLATFHIAPDPIVAGGINSFTVAGAGIDASTQIVMTWNNRYIG